MDDNHCDKLCSHSNCLISAVRGLRNGLYYGGKIRFIHALVMTILFREGSLTSKIMAIFKLTKEHALNLGLFAFIYKISVCILKHLFQTKNKGINFLAGLIGSYFMWSKNSAVNMQIMLYLLSRNLLAGVHLINEKLQFNVNLFPIASMLIWGIVMFLFEYKPKALQNSLASSMNFIYKDSDKYNSWKDFIPFYIPESFNLF